SILASAFLAAGTRPDRVGFLFAQDLIPHPPPRPTGSSPPDAGPAGLPGTPRNTPHPPFPPETSRPPRPASRHSPANRCPGRSPRASLSLAFAGGFFPAPDCRRG